MKKSDFRALSHIANLICRSVNHRLSDEEQNALNRWVAKRASRQLMISRIQSNLDKHTPQSAQPIDPVQEYPKLQKYIHRRNIYRRLRWASSLAGVLIVGLMLYFYQGSDSIERITPSQTAVLIYDDGSSVALDDLARDQSTPDPAHSSSDSRVIDFKDIPQTGASRHNTIKIERGGYYRVTLCDGTIVDMNSDSKLRYPVNFSDTSREVYLEGEAFFNVTKDRKRKFIVHARNVEIEVYGTSFNVNTYDSTNVRTVLVTGRVGVGINGGRKVKLTQSQMADCNVESGAITVNDVNTNKYISWVGGVFLFEDETLEQVLQTLSRIYDVRIVYEDDDIRDIKILAGVTRKQSIEKILSAIEKTVHVKFKTNGRTIYVSKP